MSEGRALPTQIPGLQCRQRDVTQQNRTWDVPASSTSFFCFQPHGAVAVTFGEHRTTTNASAMPIVAATLVMRVRRNRTYERAGPLAVMQGCRSSDAVLDRTAMLSLQPFVPLLVITRYHVRDVSERLGPNCSQSLCFLLRAPFG